jgi:hypothetical protein
LGAESGFVEQHTEQQAEQRTEQYRVYGRPFAPGQSGNRAGRESKAARQARLTAKMAELAEPFGGLGALDVLGRTRLEQAARLLLDTRHRSAEDEIRYVNAVERLLASVEGSCKPPSSSGVW